MIPGKPQHAPQPPAEAGGQCQACAHFIGRSSSGGDTGRCRAFGDIPPEIWSGRFDHRADHPGDGGVRFKPWKQHP